MNQLEITRQQLLARSCAELFFDVVGLEAGDSPVIFKRIYERFLRHFSKEATNEDCEDNRQREMRMVPEGQTVGCRGDANGT